MHMQLLSPPIATPTPPPAESRLLLSAVSWQRYEQLLETFGNDFPALRLSYLEGNLEIMSTSRLHEELKTMIALLLEAYLIEMDIWFHGIGAATLRRFEAARGLEPDECYCFDRVKDFPDLAIEVVVTSGLVDKLEIYRGLGTAEVWVWDDATNLFTIYHLRDSGYEVLTRSELLPGCDIALLTRHVKPNEQFAMLKAYRKAITEFPPSDL
jgi:Uma2 family endonuclease